MNINIKCPIPQSVLEIRGAQLDKLTKNKLYDAMNNGRSFDLKEYMTWVFNQKTSGNPDQEESALTYLRMIPRFIKRTMDDPGHWELRTYFREKGIDLNDLTDLALRVEDNNTGLKYLIDYMGFDKNRQEELEQYLPDRTNPVDEEELSYAREAFNLFGNLDTFNPSPSSTLIDVDFETFFDKYDTKKETGIKKPALAFYYKVKRAILDAIFSDFNGSDSSQIDYPKIGPVFLKVIDSRKIKEYPGKLRDEDPENFDPGIYMLVVDNKGDTIKFDDNANVTPDGRIAYYKLPLVTLEDFTEKNGKLIYNKDVVSKKPFEDFVTSHVAAYSKTRDEATYDLSKQLYFIYKIREYIKQNPDGDLRFIITGGSMGRIHKQGFKNFERFKPIKDIKNLTLDTFKIDEIKKVSSSGKAGFSYFKTPSTGTTKLVIERPKVSKEVAEKIASILFDNVQIRDQKGNLTPFDNSQKLRVVNGFINTNKYVPAELPQSGPSYSFYITNGENGLKIQLDGTFLESDTPQQRSESKSKLIKYLTIPGPNRVTDNVSAQGEILSTDPNYLTKITDPKNIGKTVVHTFPDGSKQFVAIDWVKQNINNDYIKNEDSTTAIEKFRDYDLTTEGDTIIATPNSTSMTQWVYENFLMPYALSDAGIIEQYNAYMTIAPTESALDKIDGIQEKEEFIPVHIPEANPIDTKKIDEEFVLDKREIQSKIARKATEEQIAEAKTWYEKHPLKEKFTFEEMFDIINVERPDSIASWSMSGIRLYKGSDYSDLYHEAWHAFTQTFLTKAQKQDLYKEASKLSGSFTDFEGNRVLFSTASNKQLEEFLAEDFRSWMLDKHKVGPKRKTLYQRILDILEILFGNSTRSELVSNAEGTKVIHDLYEKMRVGNLTEYSFNTQNTDYIYLDKMEKLPESEGLGELSYNESKLIVDTVDSLISSIIDLKNAGVNTLSELRDLQTIKLKVAAGNSITDDEKKLLDRSKQNRTFQFTTLTQNSENIAPLYKRVKEQLNAMYVHYAKSIKETPVTKEEFELKEHALARIGTIEWAIKNFGDIKNIKKNKSGVIYYHLQKSKFFKKDFVDELLEEEIEDKKQKGEKEHDKAGNEQSVFQRADDAVIYLLSSIHEKDSENRPVYNKLGIEKLAEFAFIWNRVIVTLAGTQDPEEMYVKLYKESKHYHQFKQLLDKLGPVPVKNGPQSTLWTNFWQTFNGTNIPLIQLTVDETREKLKKDTGDYDEPDPNDLGKPTPEYGSPTYTMYVGQAHGDFGKVGKEWSTIFRITTSNPFIKRVDGENRLDIKKVIEAFPNGNVKNREVEFLHAIGIMVEDNPSIRQYLKDTDVAASIYKFALLPLYKRSAVIKELTDIFKGYPKTQTYDEIKTSDSRFRDLQRSQLRYSDKFMTFMVQNAEDETQFEHSLNSTMTIIVNTINNPKVKSFNVRDSQGKPIEGDLLSISRMSYLDPEKNKFALNSDWLNKLFHIKGADGRPLATTHSDYGKRRRQKLTSGGRGPFVKLELTNLSGVAMKFNGNFTNEGSASAGADEFTKFIFDVHLAMEKGIFEMMRHSDKSTSFSTRISSSEQSYNSLYVSPISFLRKGVYGTDGFDKGMSLILPHLSGELDRINQFKKIAGSNPKNLDFTYLNAGQKFVIFDGILSAETKEKLYNLPEELNSYLGSGTPEALELTDTLMSEFKKYFTGQNNDARKLLEDADIISPTLLAKIQRDDNRPSDTLGKPMVVTNEQAKSAIIRAYVINSWIHNLESLVMFYGDLAQYNHEKEEFHKRNAGISSTGKIFRTDISFQEQMNDAVMGRGYASKLQSKEVKYNYNGTLQTAVLEDSQIDSVYIDNHLRPGIKEYYTKSYSARYSQADDKEKKEIEREINDKTELALNKYRKKELEEGNAQGWITFDSYRLLMNAEGEWSKEMEKMYQKIINKEEIKEDLTEFFPTKKLQYFGHLADTQVATIGFHKFSLYPLIPDVIKGTNLERLHDKMTNENIDYAVFKTGSKVGTITKAEGVQDKFYTDNVKRTFDTTPFTVNTIYVEYLKDQLKIAPKFKGKVIFSTQMRKLIEDGLYEYGIPTDFKTNLSLETRKVQWDALVKADPKVAAAESKNYRLVKKYENAIKDLTNIKRKKMLAEMGWKDIDGVPTGSTENLMEFVKNQFKDQNTAGDHELSFLKLDSNGDPMYDLSIVPSSDVIEKLLTSIIVKRLVKQKVKGESLIQVAVTGWEKLEQLTEPEIEKNVEIDDVLEVEDSIQIGAKFPKDQVKANYATRFIGFGPANSSTDKYRKAFGELANQDYDPEDQIMISVPGTGRSGQAENINQIKTEILKAMQAGVKVFIADNETTANSAHNKTGEGVIRQYLLDNQFIYHEKDGIGIYLAPPTGQFRKATLEEYREYGSGALPFYEKGKDRTLAMKVKIAMQGDFKNLLKHPDIINLSQATGVDRLVALNKLIRDENWLNKGDNRKMVTMIGNRIPTQGLNSMEFMEIYEFLPEKAGNIIILPSEIVSKSGSDFDIDKLNINMPNITLVNGKPSYIKKRELSKPKEELLADKAKLIEQKKEIQEKYKALQKELRKRNVKKELTDKEKEALDALNKDYSERVKEIEARLSDLRKQAVGKIVTTTAEIAEFESVQDEIYNLEQELEIIELNQRDNLNVYLTAFKSTRFNELKLSLDRELEPINEQLGDIELQFKGTSEKAYENNLLEIIQEILSLPENYGKLMVPNSTDIVKPIAEQLEEVVSDYNPKDVENGDGEKRYKIKDGKKTKIISPTRALELKYNMYKHKSNNIGKATLGLGAIDNTYNTLFNRIGAYLLSSSGTSTAYYNKILKLKAKLDNKETLSKKDLAEFNIGIKEIRKYRKQEILLPHNSIMVNGEKSISLSHIMDKNNTNVISDVISQLINGWVDIAKDAWIFNIQGNKEVAPTLLFMIQAGVPFEHAVYFISNPLIREYVKQQRRAKSTFAKLLGTAPSNKNFFRTKAQEVIFRDPKNNFEIRNKNKLYDSDIYKMEQENFKSADFSLDRLKTRIHSKSPEITELDRQVFVHYIHLEKMAGTTTKVKMAMNYDTKKTSSLFEAEDKKLLIDLLRKESNFGKGMVEAIETDSPIGSFYIQPLQLQIFGPLFKLRNNPRFVRFIQQKLEKDRGIIDRTYPDQKEKFYNIVRNDFVAYIFQNSLYPPIEKDSRYYKGFTISETFEKESVDLLTHGAYVHNNLLIVDYKKLAADYSSKEFNSDKYEKEGFATITPEAFPQEVDYLRFVFEREILRNRLPYWKIENTSEYQTYNALIEVQRIKDETKENYKLRRDKIVYDMFLRDKALDNSFNVWKIFSSKKLTSASMSSEERNKKGGESYSDQLIGITSKYPRLSTKYQLFDMLSSTSSKFLHNLRLNDVALDADKVNRWHEELLELSNETVSKVSNPEDNKWITDYFKRFALVSFLQSGINTKGAFSLIRIVSPEQWIDLIQDPVKKINKNMSNSLLEDFFKKFMQENASYRKNDRLRFKNIRTDRDLNSIILSDDVEHMRPADLSEKKGLTELVERLGESNVNKFFEQERLDGRDYSLPYYNEKTTALEITKGEVDHDEATYNQLLKNLNILKKLNINADVVNVGYMDEDGYYEDIVDYKVVWLRDRLLEYSQTIDYSIANPNQTNLFFTKEPITAIDSDLNINSEGLLTYSSKDLDVTKAQKLQNSNPNFYFVYASVIGPKEIDVTKGRDSIFGNMGLNDKKNKMKSNAIGLPVYNNYNFRLDNKGYNPKDVSNDIDSEIKNKIDRVIGSMIRLKAANKTLIFNSEGYIEETRLTSPKTYLYLSKELYRNFGFINPGFRLTPQGVSLLQEKQIITDRFIKENRFQYGPPGLPKLDNESKTCTT